MYSTKALWSAALAATLLANASVALAQEWKKKIASVGFSSVSSENQAAT